VVARLPLCVAVAVAVTQALLSNTNGVVRVCDLVCGRTHGRQLPFHRSDIMDTSLELGRHEPPSGLEDVTLRN
jgi:hypothetical protein